MNCIIFSDNKYQSRRLGILRSPGAHRIATELRRLNIKTEVVDFYLSWTIDEIKTIIDCQLNADTLFVGFSCSLMFDGVTEFKIIRDYIKDKNPNIPIVVGGNKTLQKGFDNADYYIDGHGEVAIKVLVEHLLDKSKPLVHSIVDGNKVVDSIHHYPVTDLNNLDIEYSESDFISSNEVLSIETARGCIFKCKFCDFPLIGKSKLDYLRNPNEIRNEFIRNYEEYGTYRYFLTEDTFNDVDEKVNLIYDLSQSLPFKLELMSYIRADLLAAKPYNLDKLVQSGFKAMHFGIETFNERAGKIIGKGMNPDKMKDFLLETKSKYPHLFLNSTFIVGLPYDTPEDIWENVKWIVDSKALDFWSFNPLVIPKKDPNIHGSYFTDNYRLYGYKPMSAIEIEDYYKGVAGTSFGLKFWKDIILWKSKKFTSLTAAQLTFEINQWANPYKKVDAWTSFAISGLGYEIDDIFKHTYNGDFPLDQDLITSQSDEYVNNYKKKKLNFLQKRLS